MNLSLKILRLILENLLMLLFILSFLVFAALLIYALKNLYDSIFKQKEKSNIAFGLLWFFITVSITSNVFFLIGTSFGERLFFTPSLGLCIAFVILLSKYFYKKDNAQDGSFMKAFSRSASLWYSVALRAIGVYSVTTVLFGFSDTRLNLFMQISFQK